MVNDKYILKYDWETSRKLYVYVLWKEYQGKVLTFNGKFEVPKEQMQRIKTKWINLQLDANK